ncbi:hypothetical protein V499_05464 [Pseudogymnoascus sp. VKM F-103]|nr:hypothetical protein V499_05464 [Pseudogymnoascus sp. VKM F-103]
MIAPTHFRTWAFVLVAPALLVSHCAALEPEFDFIIVGGGTAGLTLANRLTEFPHVTVAVIEAGGEVINNPNVTDPNSFTLALGTAIDWQYESVNQTHAGDQKIAYHSGKALGGTSTINGMTYVRAEKAQIDAWEKLGNSGWSWDDLFPYYLKSEQFDSPTSAQVEAGATYVSQQHGKKGPLNVGYGFGLLNGTYHEVVEQAWNNLGIPTSLDVNGGNVRGFTVWQSTMNRDANLREDAGRAYYYPVQSRPNLHVFLNTVANRITWRESTSECAVAGGVEITAADGTVTTLDAKREVILSAGSLRSPAILELSGIGNPSILNKSGIPVKVNLPAVGENLQDQPNSQIIMSSNTTFSGSIPYVAFGSASDFLDSLPKNVNLTAWAEKVAVAIDHAISISSLEQLFRIQYELINNGVVDAESILETTFSIGLGPSSLVASAFWLLLPFSRGNVHISSSDPLAYPVINPNYFLVDFDVDVQVAIAKWTRKFWETPPIQGLATETSPGFDALPKDASYEQWANWVKTTFAGNSHPLGTAAMMSRELGGVVDSELRVYGTQNVRVVDASVIPTQVSGHLTSTIYAIAEKIADVIKVSI